MSKDTASRVRALAWSTKMRGLQRGWRCGGGTGGWVWGLWKRGRLQWLASIDLLCAAILPPFATGVDHPLPPHPPRSSVPTPPTTHSTIHPPHPARQRQTFWKMIPKVIVARHVVFQPAFFFACNNSPFSFSARNPFIYRGKKKRRAEPWTQKEGKSKRPGDREIINEGDQARWQFRDTWILSSWLCQALRSLNIGEWTSLSCHRLIERFRFTTSWCVINDTQYFYSW